MSSLAGLGYNITIEEQRITMRLSKEAFGEISLLEWPSFTEDLQRVLEDILASTYGTFVVQPLESFHFGI